MQLQYQGTGKNHIVILGYHFKQIFFFWSLIPKAWQILVPDPTKMVAADHWFLKKLLISIPSLILGCVIPDPTHAILIPESSGLFCHQWAPGETLEQWNQSAPEFLAQNNSSLDRTANQNKKDILFEFPRFSPGNQPLTKKPEDSGIKIEIPPFWFLTPHTSLWPWNGCHLLSCR